MELRESENAQLDACVALLKTILKEDLRGVYLYGSAVIGGLQKFSDLDLFVVTSRSLTDQEKVKLIHDLLHISGIYRQSIEKRPIEMTIVVQSELNPWKYPPSADFQYGEWLRGAFESGNWEHTQPKVNPDLALLVTQVLLASETLYGEKPHQLLPSVPVQDFMQALTEGIEDLRSDLFSDTRNVLLTLARIWMTTSTYAITSKQNAAMWSLQRLPDNLQVVMQRAVDAALGIQEEKWDDIEEVIPLCADFMIGEIKREALRAKDSSLRKETVFVC